ncbi:MAG: hypothetical protein DRO23_10405 [Thermoprotei archaeon]|nr:MAG: hypothetical protein DRO23_10405 [Thermoprotei archaeon]
MMVKGNVEVKTKSRGLLRALVTRESLFVNIYKARSSSATLQLALPIPEGIRYIKLGGAKGVIVNDKCYLACHGNVQHKVVWRGLRGIFGEGGLMWLHFTGVGGIWVNIPTEVLLRGKLSLEKSSL